MTHQAEVASVRASARKSPRWGGEYKPVIVYPNGRTEIVEQSSERFDKYTQRGVIPGYTYARGNTYANREDAVAAAQRWIEACLAGAIEARARHALRYPDKVEDRAKHHDAAIALWGGPQIAAAFAKL